MHMDFKVLIGSCSVVTSLTVVCKRPVMCCQCRLMTIAILASYGVTVWTNGLQRFMCTANLTATAKSHLRYTYARFRLTDVTGNYSVLPSDSPHGIRKVYPVSLGHCTIWHPKSFCGIFNKICIHEAKIYTTNKYG